MHRTVTLALTSLMLASSAHAADAGAVIASADEAMNRAKDQVIEWDVVNQEPGKKEPKTMHFTSTVMGQKTLTEFSAPADLKGTRVLVLSREQMYIYLPQFAKVRRVAQHTTQQGFMGTTFSFDDMNTSRFGDVYSGSVKAENGKEVTLELTPLSADTAPYAKAEIVFDTEMGHPLSMKYFNADGKHVKTETRSEYACKDDVCLAGVIRMEDHTRDGAWTELRRTAWELNTGVDADVFTTRNLQRGE